MTDRLHFSVIVQHHKEPSATELKKQQQKNKNRFLYAIALMNLFGMYEISIR